MIWFVVRLWWKSWRGKNPKVNCKKGKKRVKMFSHRCGRATTSTMDPKKRPKLIKKNKRNQRSKE